MLLEGSNHMLCNLVITRQELIKRFSKLAVNKASAVDGVLPRVLMVSAYCLNEPTIYIHDVP